MYHWDPDVDRMIARLVDPIDHSTEIAVLERFTKIAHEHGFGENDLRPVRNRPQPNLLGIRRDAQHLCGVMNVEGGVFHKPGASCFSLLARYAIIARTTGVYAGRWHFAMDSEGDVYANHDGEPCAQFNGLSDSELLRAVLSSSMTEPVAEPRRRWGFSWRTR